MKKYENFRQEKFEKLENILLKEGGTSVKYTYEEDLEELLDDGLFLYPEDLDIKFLGMKPSQCHHNSAVFYENWMNEHNSPDEISIMSGWVLSDNIWYQHSCIYFPYDDQIVETTEERDMYYGFLLNGEKLQKFLDEN